MKNKPVVNLREFRFSKLNDPQFAHLKYLAGWIFYFTMYFLTENLIPAERLHLIHSPLDDLIPFCEYFVVVYCFWYAFVFFSLLHYGIYDPELFKKLQTFIIITQVVAMAVYIIYPSVQDLRPTVFENPNFFTKVIAFIYSFDTPTGIFPSLHVAYSLGIMSTALKDRNARTGMKIFAVVATVVISASTLFVKQHSIHDIWSALLLGLLAEILTFGKSYWLPRLKKSTNS